MHSLSTVEFLPFTVLGKSPLSNVSLAVATSRCTASGIKTRCGSSKQLGSRMCFTSRTENFPLSRWNSPRLAWGLSVLPLAPRFPISCHEGRALCFCASKVIEAPLPPCPVEISVMTHWLAVNGVQPEIPENIPIEPKMDRKQRPEAPRGQASAPAVAARPGEKPLGSGLGGGAKPGPKAKDTGLEDVQVQCPMQHTYSTPAALLLARRVFGSLDCSRIRFSP